MRIAFVAYHGSVHTRRWVAFFARRGHEAHVVTCGGGSAAESALAAEDLGYFVHDLGPPRLGKVGYLSKVGAARRILRRLEPDLVHAHWATSYGALAVAAGMRPLIVTAHGDDVLAAKGAIKRCFVSAILRRAQLLTVPGEHMHDAVQQLAGTKTPPVLVFQYGVEVARLSQQRAVEELTVRPADVHAPLRIVSVRPLTTLYRVDLLIAALSVLRSRGVPFTCEIIGDGPERARLERWAEAAFAGDVHFSGTLTPAEVELAMSHADIFVSLAASDGTSLALLEAMSLGAVPVLSDIPANRAWADPEAAVLVSANPTAVADGIERATRLDRAVATQRNRQIVLARGDLVTNLGRFEDVLRSLCAVRV